MKRVLCMAGIVFLIVLGFEETAFFCFRNEYGRMWKAKEYQTLSSISESVIRTAPSIDVVLEDVYEDNNITEERLYFDERIAGMDREELAAFVDDPYNMGSADDFEKGYYECCITEFNRNRIRIKRKFSPQKSRYLYKAYLLNDQIYIIKNSNDEYAGKVYAKRSSMELDVLKKLESGIFIRDINDLYSFMKNEESGTKVEKYEEIGSCYYWSRSIRNVCCCLCSQKWLQTCNS